MFDAKGPNREMLFQGIVSRLNKMPALLRQVFVLHHYHGYSDTEIARLTGLKEKHIPALLQSAEELVYGAVRRLRSE